MRSVIGFSLGKHATQRKQTATVIELLRVFFTRFR